MTDAVLMSLARGVDPEALDDVRAGGSALALRGHLAEVERDGAPVSLGAFVRLMEHFRGRRPEFDEPRDRPKTDAWLAPRVHWALRLSRREAADRSVWAYIANVVCPDYVQWRWGHSGKVAANRWDGPHHKQAIARLWWGAELFRNGADYRPVERLFANQDFPNSYIHRVFVRSRPFALGLLDAITMAAGGDATKPTSDQINDVARKVNLRTAAQSIEAATRYHRDDVAAHQAWIREAPDPGWDYGRLPAGPPDGGVRPASLGSAVAIGTEICALAGVAG
jgi:hypothetical protein